MAGVKLRYSHHKPLNTLFCYSKRARFYTNMSSRVISRTFGEPKAAKEVDVLFFSTVWPETSSSAAGVRTRDLIDGFQKTGSQVAYVCSSSVNEYTDRLLDSGVQVFYCAPNREDAVSNILTSLRPSKVIFDRFYAEEMWSFRVKSLLPEAVRILDMQDVHFLRESRQDALKSGASLEDVLNIRPTASAISCQRELASIYRSDLTLVCSPEELRLLTQHYNVPKDILQLAPFFVDKKYLDMDAPSFKQRQHFMMIGSFRHPPNLDSVRWAVNEIWPLIRQNLQKHLLPGKRLPELHIFGSYCPSSAQDEFHRPGNGVFVKGFTPTLEIMNNYRLCLAPLRYGAGLKGKIIDSWCHGMPVCTTPVGAEGLVDEDSKDGWGGLYKALEAETLARDAAFLYSTEDFWRNSQQAGFRLLANSFDRESGLENIIKAVQHRHANLEEFRAQNYFGAILWHQQMRSTEYFSRWIELKERLNQK
jgi:glycosyltransferase involved in cell wall biosynthesis